MSNPINILIMIHGISPEKAPYSPSEKYYKPFWQAMVYKRQGLADLIHKKIHVQWGHQIPNPNRDTRDDEKLPRTEQAIHDLVSYDAVRAKPSPNNILLTGFSSDFNPLGVPRLLSKVLKEHVVLYGFGDVIYYCSDDGEKRVRNAVYDQALSQLDPFLSAPEVRFHIIGHSLGVTISHDFLYGLFAPLPSNKEPDFISQQQGNIAATERFKRWREKAQNGQLKLGTLISMASQLPVFVMRKQSLIDKLYNNEYLDPIFIGIPPTGKVRWKIFYDIDDVLGFPTRNLYAPNDSIVEIQIACGDEPVSAHNNYWRNETVIKETAKTIFKNAL